MTPARPEDADLNLSGFFFSGPRGDGRRMLRQGTRTPRRHLLRKLPSPVHQLAIRRIRVMMAVMLPVLFALMTYNVNYANPDPDASIDVIAAADADVVLLQEITAAWQARLQQRLGKQ